MAVYLVVDDAMDDQIATNFGWSDFGAWVKTKPEAMYVNLLYEEGVSIDPKKVKNELTIMEKMEMPEDVKSVLVGLLDILEGVPQAGFIMITNGMAKIRPGDANGQSL